MTNSTVEIESLLTFIHSILQVSEPVSLDDKIEKKLHEFISSYGPETIYVIKREKEIDIYNDTNEIQGLNDVSSVSIMIKLKGQLKSSISWEEQINIINIPTPQLSNTDKNHNESFEKLRTMINMGIYPFFEMLTSSSSSEDKLKIINTTRKRFTELSLSLQHIQQRIQVPDLLASVHPKINELCEEGNGLPEEIISESTLLNEITNIVNSWIKEIQAITGLNHNPTDGTSILEEVQFWRSLESSLLSINEQLSSKEVTTTIEVLNKAKRFNITISFQSDIGLNEKLAQTKLYNSLLKDLPIDDLLSVPINDKDKFSRFEHSMISLFNHLKKLKNLPQFPLSRALDITEVVLNDVLEKMLAIILAHQIMSLSIVDFTNLYDIVIMHIFNLIDQNIKFMINLIRELSRKRQEKFIAVKINTELFEELKKQMVFLKNIRMKYADIMNISNQILPTIEYEKLKDAYEKYIIPTDFFDFSKKNSLRTINYDLYLTVFQNLESKITRELISLCDSCVNLNDLISILRKYKDGESPEGSNGHLVHFMNDEFKIKILNIAISEVKGIIDIYNDKSTKMAELLNHVLKEKVQIQGRESSSITQKLIWNISVSEKLNFYLSTLTEILGTNWNQYSLGTKLYSDIKNILETADPERLYQNWIAAIEENLLPDKIVSIKGTILCTIKSTTDLVVNFDFEKMEIYNEIKLLSDMGFEIPFNMKRQFNKIDKIYPFVIGLVEYVNVLKQMFLHSLAQTEYGQKYGFIIENQKLKVGNKLKEVKDVEWVHLSQALELQNLDSFESDFSNSDNANLIELKSWNKVQSFQEEVSCLYDQVNKLEALHLFLSGMYKKIENDPFEQEVIRSHLKSIRQEVSSFSSPHFSNIDILCEDINGAIKAILIQKLKNEVSYFTNFLELDEENRLDNSSDFMKKFTHKIVFQDQNFAITPPLEDTKAELFKIINKYLAVIEGQEFLSYGDSRGIDMTLNVDNINNDLYGLLKNIDKVLSASYAYLSKWRTMQNLWELDLESEEEIEKLLPHNLSITEWVRIMYKINEFRKMFDSSDTVHEIGKVISLNYFPVKSRVNIKFDRFQHDLMIIFARKYQERYAKLDSLLTSAYNSLEAKLDLNTEVSHFILLANEFLDVMQKINIWTEEAKSFRNGQVLLSKQRFKFPSNWCYVEKVENTLANISKLIWKKKQVLETNKEIIISKVRSESSSIYGMRDVERKKWNERKPVSGKLSPTVAITVLNNTSNRISELENLTNALESVALYIGIELDHFEDLLDIEEEIKDLRTVWSSLDILWQELQKLESIKWSEVNPRKLRHVLDELLMKSRSFSAQIRQYAAFDELQGSIKYHIRSHHMISELRNEALKPRHWKLLLKKLGLDIPVEKLTLKDVWNFNFSLNNQIIKSVINQAVNEQAIELSLENIRKNWENAKLETFMFDNKCQLVRNWDRLFDQTSNDINTLESMKNSQYYSIFELEINAFRENLNNFYVLMDVWIEVQRHWVYLDGVFGNKKGDVKTLLPVESARFSNISYEFLTLLKKAFKMKNPLNILSITGIQKTMEKFSDSLNKIRKSLVDYLERQRELFPRFYFIGNEDLLEIIGGSSVIDSVNRHMKKMFPGVSRIELNDDKLNIVAIYSEQNEKLVLANPISVVKYPYLIDWLKQLELEIKMSLSILVKTSIPELLGALQNLNTFDKFYDFVQELPVQVSSLITQIYFTELVDKNLEQGDFLEHFNNYKLIFERISAFLEENIVDLQRRKLEFLMIEIVHQRDIISQLIDCKSLSDRKLIWYTQQRFYYNVDSEDLLSSLIVKQASAEFQYGFEYLGIPEKLAYTPLLDKCFLSMSQALHQKLGGSPFGPAGTGKTESIKALGNNLGKMVLTFCCDSSFDYQSMGRIFLGLCKVGSWGCFDEFNRLDENILSAISSQIESIEYGLSNSEYEVEITGKKTTVNPETGIFVTMNPGYAGRSELPENLKKLFRAFSMEKPDREVIAEVILSSQTFKLAKELSKIVVPFFLDLESSCSKQPHYDLGLRTLKATLIKCGLIKRNKTKNTGFLEKHILLRSMRETIVPKLIKEDVQIFDDLERKYFPDGNYMIEDLEGIIEQLKEHGESKGYLINDEFITKAIQLYQTQEVQHGTILVGESGSGKSVVWSLLLECISKITGVDNMSFVIDCKVMLKEELFGSLDTVTRDWKDGTFTSILRRVVNNLRGELSKRIWIVFDGDLDPEWAETLNSVLDDNKLLTLPNGERLELPPNVRLIFEVDQLKYATLATISRCGMIWFDKSVVGLDALHNKMIYDLGSLLLENDDDSPLNREELSPICDELVEHIKNLLSVSSLYNMIEIAQKFNHIMAFNKIRGIHTLCNFLRSFFRNLILYKSNNLCVPVNLYAYVKKSLLLSIIWALAGDMSLEEREEYSKRIAELEIFSDIDIINDNNNFIDYEISLPEAEWVSWNMKVQSVDLEPHQVNQPNIVIPTLDTVRHENIIYSMLNEHCSLLLCGPPGSGKTMTLLEALRKSPNLDLLPLNFSKETSPNSLIKSLEQVCKYEKTKTGINLIPKAQGKWVVVFCDELNLPQYDNYGTQTVISLLRQIIEQKGFWNTQNKQWVNVINIQFVGACNPPTDPGRQVLSSRFLRHVSLIMVDYPGKNSLMQIYNTFNTAAMKFAPDLKGFTKFITEAMIEVYYKSREKLNQSIQNHYVYSPRELTRWSRGIIEALSSSDYDSLSSFVRLWYHEGLRLFYDKLVGEEEKKWTKELFCEVIGEYFPNIDIEELLKEPILFSNWLTLKYESVEKNDLLSFVAERLRVFSEEEIEVDIVLYQDFLDHCLRIDRVLRQPQGHMILVGPSSSGKTTISKFVAWINGIKVFQLSVHKNYGLADFDTTLRNILLECAKGEKVLFLIDESSILESSFVERMNTLLANAEVPGLFVGDDYSSLMNLCLEQSQIQGLLLDTDEELYEWFNVQISSNLHVIFTIDEKSEGNRPNIISSPALYNRCVLSWMGDWSNESLFTISKSLISDIPLDLTNYSIPQSFEKFIANDVRDFREIVIDTLIYFHRMPFEYKATLNYSRTPSNFISLLKKFASIYNEKLFKLEESQRHISDGLDKLRVTVLEVKVLQQTLSEKNETLSKKDKEARQMLDKMLKEQNEAERKQELSFVTREELSKQEVELNRRKNIVLRDLELAEPAMVEAQRGVQNIKKQHLTEIRSMSNPPAAVKMTMESVCILLGYDVSTWRDVQLVVRRDDFIANIVSFNNEEQLTSETRAYMEEVYLSREDYNFEAVNRASKACGPLLQWVKAQLTYSSVLEKVEPLREEVKMLESLARMTEAQLIAIEQMIKELEGSIAKYKEGYSSLIRDAENIKTEMQTVERRVSRSLSLIEKLTNERERWKVTITKFRDERERLIGDCLLQSAFTVYAGLYDQKGRSLLVQLWTEKLANSGIPLNHNLSIANGLVNKDEMGNWNVCGLESDDLNRENLAIIKWVNIPLIIDPLSQIIDVLAKIIYPKKLIVTSFLNKGFIKKVEDGIRFGGTVLIQDAEQYDCILDFILRHEIHRNGGRIMIRLGDDSIDYSPDFKLILHSKESNVNFSSFVLSRTTIVNFTITKGSLENQILSSALRNLKPELENKRSELLSLQSEYQIRLFDLESKLLELLNESSGIILENDELIQTLESLKTEANSIDKKIEESQSVIKEVDDVRNKYEDFAIHSTIIFKILEKINLSSSFYSFSFSDLISTFSFVLSRESKDLSISRVITEFYKEIYAIISPSLTYVDKIAFSVALWFSYYAKEIGDHLEKSLNLIFRSICNRKYQELIEEVMRINLVKYEEEINLENLDKVLIENKSNESFTVLYDIIKGLLLSSQKRDSCLDAFTDISRFVSSGSSSFSSKYEISDWLSDKMNTNIFLLVSPENNDPTYIIENLSKKMKQQLRIISMGSKEGIEMAMTGIKEAAKDSCWVLLQNIQMSSGWLNTLDKQLETISEYANVKIFMTCNLSSKIPNQLVRKSKVITFENSSGLKNNLRETFNLFSKDVISKYPSEFKKVYFLTVWFHSIILERTRYVPISFSKMYDINDSDMKAALLLLMNLWKPFENRTNISPQLIPWKEICYMICEIVYGGKFDKIDDLNYVKELASRTFREESFNLDFNLIENEITTKQGETLHMPEGITLEAYEDWISSLPDSTPLTWVGLEEDANILLRENLIEQISTKVLEIV